MNSKQDWRAPPGKALAGEVMCLETILQPYNSGTAMRPQRLNVHFRLCRMLAACVNFNATVTRHNPIFSIMAILGRRATAKRGVWPVGVVEIDVATDARAGSAPSESLRIHTRGVF